MSIHGTEFLSSWRFLFPCLFSSSDSDSCYEWRLYRQVSVEEGETKTKELGALMIETSAKAGFNIKVRKFSLCSSTLEIFFGPTCNMSFKPND